MAIHGYPGGIISATAPTTSPTSASGVWTLDDQLQNINNWPQQSASVQRSLRFRKSASAYLSRTPSVAGNERTWTWSAWIKRGELSTYQDIFGGGSTGISRNCRILFDAGASGQTNNILVFLAVGGLLYGHFTTAVYRDPSSWYHLVVAVDTTQSVAADRVKVWINNVQQSMSATYSSGAFPLNQQTGVNSTTEQRIGDSSVYSPSFFDGYMADINLIDGQALTPSSFGQFDGNTGVWQPIQYRGTYGTNGFYLPFTDNSSLTTSSNVGLGKDFSGNGNYWTTNNISITSGTTYDSMTDVPTLTSATQANYPVLNPLANGSATLSNGNLSVSGGNDLPCTMVCPPSGHWYVEFSKSNATAAAHLGIYDATSTPATINKAILYAENGGVFVNNSQVTTFASYANGDIISMGVDIDTGNLYFSKNNVYQGSVGIASSGISLSNVVIGVRCNTGVTANINFGQRPFTYPPTLPVRALNTFNLPTPTIGATASTQANDYFDVSLWTGNGTSQTITNSGSMQPDFVWVKQRSSTQWHRLVDAVRGTNKILYSNDTSAEFTDSTQITAFNSNGFSVGSEAGVNANSATYVGWQWRGANGTVTNTAGSITSTVSANTSSGFSIVTYTGTGANATVGHGLGVAPRFILVKSRNNADNWYAYHASIGNTGALNPNLTNATITNSGYWNNTSPTSSVFTVGTIPSQNTWTYVAYLFAEVAGFSRFGSYTGNGSTDGPFIYTGFRPAYVMIKGNLNGYNWVINDEARNPSNAVSLTLRANTDSAESDESPGIDFLSNGFKIRNTYGNYNNNGTTYIYMAFAESPFKYANAR